jgi:hypothetical protein
LKCRVFAISHPDPEVGDKVEFIERVEQCIAFLIEKLTAFRLLPRRPLHRIRTDRGVLSAPQQGPKRRISATFCLST